jgi:hypothetical protein
VLKRGVTKTKKSKNRNAGIGSIKHEKMVTPSNWDRCSGVPRNRICKERERERLGIDRINACILSDFITHK